MFYFTQGAVSAADAFFATIARSGPAIAYREASPAFQANGTEAAFAASAEKLGLTRFKSASWSSRSMQGGQTELSGTLTLSDGNALPATVKLVKAADGDWRVFSLNIPTAGARVGDAQPPLPDQAAANELVKLTLGRLAAAVNANDFRGFHLTSSRQMQEQLGPEKMHANFQPFVERHIDLGQAMLTDPVLTAPPVIDGEGSWFSRDIRRCPSKNGFLISRMSTSTRNGS